MLTADRCCAVCRHICIKVALGYQVAHGRCWLPTGVAMSVGHVFTRFLMMMVADKSYVMPKLFTGTV